MRTLRALRWVWLGIFATCLLLSAQGGTESVGQDYDALFQRLVSAEGQDYFDTRKLLLERGEQAAPFVKTQIAHSNLQTRVLARAVLGWIGEEPLNKERNMHLLYWVYRARHVHVGPAVEVIGYAHYNRTHDVKQPLPMLRCYDASRHFPSYDTATAFLLEVAMKGVDPEQKEIHSFPGERSRGEMDMRAFTSPNPGQPTNQEIVQAVAAALLAGVEDKDAIEVLKLLYEKGGRTMRRVAAIGLKRAGIETEEPLDTPVDWWW